MSARLDELFVIVLDFPAPENHLAFFIRGLQLQPDIEGVHGAAREKVPDLARSHHHIHPHVIAAPHCGVGAIDGRGNGAKFTSKALWQCSLRFLTNGERRREFLFSQLAAQWRTHFLSCRGKWRKYPRSV